MCQCTPEIKTPYCGRPGCEWPHQTVRLIAKQRRSVLVDVPIMLVAARLCTNSVEAGLWQSLKRHSALSGKPFPVGSSIVMVMYRDGDTQLSGACHLDELPAEVQGVVVEGKTWKEKT